MPLDPRRQRPTRLSEWLRQVRLLEMPHIIRILKGIQRLMNATAYLTEHAATDGQSPEASSQTLHLVAGYLFKPHDPLKSKPASTE